MVQWLLDHVRLPLAINLRAAAPFFSRGLSPALRCLAPSRLRSTHPALHSLHTLHNLSEFWLVARNRMHMRSQRDHS
jgi:hypothetical protein